MMKKLIILLMTLTAITATAATPKRENAKAPGGYNFWFVDAPREEADTAAKPLVVFLHGASLCGRNMDKVLRYGTIDAVRKGRIIDGYVVAPQNPGGAWKPDKVMDIVDWAIKNHNVDPNRVYVLGMSLGGFGTMDVAAKYPDRIAAAIAMCGGSTAKDPATLNGLPFWIIHGTADRAVPVSASDKVVAAMKKSDPATPRLHYDRVPGMNHGQPSRMFYLKQTYDWLFQHSLTDPGRPIAKTFYPSSQTLRSAYGDLNTSRRRAANASGK